MYMLFIVTTNEKKRREREREREREKSFEIEEYVCIRDGLMTIWYAYMKACVYIQTEHQHQ